jgi:hypothetical protein
MIVVTITEPAIEAGARRAQSMGFAMNPIMVASILEAAFQVMFPDVEIDNEEYKAAKTEDQLRQIVAFLNQIAQKVIRLEERFPDEGNVQHERDTV